MFECWLNMWSNKSHKPCLETLSVPFSSFVRLVFLKLWGTVRCCVSERFCRMRKQWQLWKAWKKKCKNRLATPSAGWCLTLFRFCAVTFKINLAKIQYMVLVFLGTNLVKCSINVRHWRLKNKGESQKVNISNNTSIASLPALYCSSSTMSELQYILVATRTWYDKRW